MKEKVPEISINSEIELVGELHDRVNVLLFGADNTGANDSTPAFQEAMNYIKTLGGGKLIIPQGKYWLNDHVELCSNVYIQGIGSPVLFSTSSSKDYVAFYGKSYKKGYDGGVQNIIIDGCTFKGSFTVGKRKGSSCTFHHARNILVKNCLFTESVINGHSLDLLGCMNVKVLDCIFEGFDVQEGREYVEAIQIDHSNAESNGSNDTDYSTNDGLATINVTVERCEFRPLKIGDKLYPAPNPLGSHSRVIGNKFNNIKFINNVVKDCVDTSTTTYCKGWLHFCWADNILVEGNLFESTTNSAHTVITTPTFSTAFPVSVVDNPNAEKVSTTPAVTRGLTIKNNIFKGFSTNKNEPLVDIKGMVANGVNYYTHDVIINENQYVNCIPSNATLPSNTGSDLINLELAENIVIAFNTLYNCKRLLTASRVRHLKVESNKIQKNYWVAINTEESYDVDISNNSLWDYACGFYFKNNSVLQITRNSLAQELVSSAAATTYEQAIAINSCNDIIVDSNRIVANSNTLLKRGINIYGTSTNGRIHFLIVKGFPQRSGIGGSTNNIQEINPIV
ncbi:glycosyl hydrolase family 28-related protein [Cytobacillus horneckiae]|uniref:glycosyl hydrolase family 28-related protein n=1 Tax=Cytobacillus horneckiae TaxID=549687 RepID=UPI003D9A7EFA